MTSPRISVCMASYNGAELVEEQLTSILAQLGPHDEVVIVDDASTDGTVARVLAVVDPRVHVETLTDNVGYVRAFERALRTARGDVVLLSDQDDVWMPGRVHAMVDALARADVVATNLATLDGPATIRGPYGQHDWRLHARQSRQPARNIAAILIGNRPYYGCAMGLRRSAIDAVLPFPAYLTESHDLWIALYGNVAHSIEHLDLRSVARRFHAHNATPDRPRGLVQVVRSRTLLVRCVLELRRRVRR